MKGKMKWIIGISIIAVIIIAIVIMLQEMQFAYKIEEVKEINYVTLVKEETGGVSFSQAFVS